MHRPSRVLSTRRIAGCRSLCNFVTSSIRPCNSVMTRNDAAARQAGRTCATGPVSPISTIFLPIPTSSPHLSFETFGKMKKFYSEIFFLDFYGWILYTRVLNSRENLESRVGINVDIPFIERFFLCSRTQNREKASY